MTMEPWAEIRSLHEQGLATAAFARRFGIGRIPVTRYLDRPSPPAYKPRASGAPLAPYQDYLRNRLTEFPEKAGLTSLDPRREPAALIVGVDELSELWPGPVHRGPRAGRRVSRVPHRVRALFGGGKRAGHE